MKTPLFIYGTLTFPEILEGLTGKTFERKPARLSGYQRYAIQDRPYPAITEKPGSEVDGFLIDADEASARIIGFFEAPEYEKRQVEVSCEGEVRQAAAYAWQAAHRALLSGEWSPEEFSKNHLQRYAAEVIPRIRSLFQQKGLK